MLREIVIPLSSSSSSEESEDDDDDSITSTIVVVTTETAFCCIVVVVVVTLCLCMLYAAMCSGFLFLIAAASPTTALGSVRVTVFLTTLVTGNTPPPGVVVGVPVVEWLMYGEVTSSDSELVSVTWGSKLRWDCWQE